MKVASLCSFPVGVVRWRSPAPSLTVVVKVTLSLATQEASIADRQEPLSLDRRRAGSPELELHYPSDFVPKKARSDVLLVGHARAPVPSRAIEARLAVGDFEKRFFAVSAEPSRQIRLRDEDLRMSSSEGGPRASVGPRAPKEGEGGALLRWDALLRTPLVEGFDFGVFNAAPRDQQVASLDAGLRLSLEGLLPGARPAELWLSGERPRIYAVARGGAHAGPLIEIPLACDTLWIDVDRALCALSWRGSLTVNDGREMPSQLVATSAPTWMVEHPSSVIDRLREANVVRAVEASDLAPSASDLEDDAIDADDEEAPVTPVKRVALGAFRLGAGPAAQGPITREPRASMPIEDPRTIPLPDDELTIEEIVDAESVIEDEVTAAPDAGPPKFAPALPFQPPIPFYFKPLPDAAPPPPISVAPLASSAPPIGAALAAAIVPAPSPPRAPARPLAPVLPLSTYAAVRAAVWEEGVPVEEVLERLGINELAWHESEQRRREELSEEASRGGSSLALSLAAAIAGERARRASTSGDELTLDDYVALRIAMDTASDVGWLLRDRGLTPAAWQRADRAWRSRASADGVIARALRDKLAERRGPPKERATSREAPIVGRRIKIARPPA